MEGGEEGGDEGGGRGGLYPKSEVQSVLLAPLTEGDCLAASGLVGQASVKRGSASGLAALLWCLEEHMRTAGYMVEWWCYHGISCLLQHCQGIVHRRDSILLQIHLLHVLNSLHILYSQEEEGEGGGD